MSGFVVIFERSSVPVDPLGFKRSMDRLCHRGPDGSDSFALGNISMGHWHFWTTPEEVGERQPLGLDGLPFRIVLDGRLDNREELFAKLNIPQAQGESLSDAELILHAYANWKEDSFKHFVGEFAIVIFDEERNEVICARDQLGDRTLFYAFYDTCLVIASEPWAVAGFQDTKPELNEAAIAHYFAFKIPEDGQTFFDNIYELMPAHIMVIGTTEQHVLCYWESDLRKKIRYQTDQEYTEHFLALLENSVRCRMRANTPVSVLMSGGLDSTSVACLAAQMLIPRQLTTISYIFDEFPSSDERKYIDAVKEHLNSISIQIISDEYWPFKDWQIGSYNQNQPEVNIYWLLDKVFCQHAQIEGQRVLLTGKFGDQLYGARSNWLADLISDGRFLEAFLEIVRCLRKAGWQRNWQAGYLQRVLIRFINRLGIKRLHRKNNLPDWLTPYSKDILQSKYEFDERSYGPTSNWVAERSSIGISTANRYAVELRHPYRDRRLLEFMLAIPAYQLHRCGSSKHILRDAMKSKLPELVRCRMEFTSLMPLFSRGLEREKIIILDWLQNPVAEWRRFVKSDWVLNPRVTALSQGRNGPHVLVPWLCLSFEAWCRNFIAQK